MPVNGWSRFEVAWPWPVAVPSRFAGTAANIHLGGTDLPPGNLSTHIAASWERHLPGKPDGQGRDRPSARQKAAQLRAKQLKQERRRRLLLVGGAASAVVLVIVAMVLVYALKGDKKNAVKTAAAPASVVSTVTGVPTSIWEKVGKGTATALPKAVTGSALTKDGKPLIVYIGAESCPYCAGERWAMVNALSRFGTWSNLGATTSASQDVHPNTPTFSFHGATYTSQYLAFEGVEKTTNQAISGGYQPLDTPTAAQSKLQAQYGTDSSGSQGIPFIDFGNKFTIVGATYDVSPLDGQSIDEIAANLSDPANASTKGILGSANAITAAICKITNDRPANVCSSSAIKTLESQLK